MTPHETACYEMNDALHDLLEHTRDRVGADHPAFVRCKDVLDAIGMAYKAEMPVWHKLADEKPPTGIYLFYYPSYTGDSGNYAESIDRAFWDADDGRARGDYHGPWLEPTHWMPQPGVPS